MPAHKKTLATNTSALAEALTSNSVRELDKDELEIVSGGGIVEDLVDAIFTTTEINKN